MNTCKICESPLVNQQKKYCSHRCHIKAKQCNTYECQQRRGHLRKQMFIDRLGGKCCKCGYNKNKAALHFHHVDPSTKLFGLDLRKLSNCTLEKLEAELLKCILVCANCHREIHEEIINSGLEK